MMKQELHILFPNYGPEDIHLLISSLMLLITLVLFALILELLVITVKTRSIVKLEIIDQDTAYLEYPIYGSRGVGKYFMILGVVIVFMTPITFLIAEVYLGFLPTISDFLTFQVGASFGGVAFFLLGNFLNRYAQFIIVDRSQNLMTKKTRFLGLYKRTSQQWRLLQIKSVEFRYEQRPTSRSQLRLPNHKIVLKFRNGEEIPLIKSIRIVRNPVTCLKILNQFIEGVYLVPGVFQDIQPKFLDAREI